MSNTPTDAEIVAVMRDGYNCRYNDEADHVDFARAVLAKWGTPQPAPQTIRRFYRGTDCMAENQAGDWVRYEDHIAALAEAQQPSPTPQADSVLEDAARWKELRAQHEDDAAERCCVFAPNDMRECLVPVGSLPGELDAFIDARIAARKQGANHD